MFFIIFYNVFLYKLNACMKIIYKSFNKYFLHKKNIIVYCKIISYTILLYIVNKIQCNKIDIEKINI